MKVQKDRLKEVAIAILKGLKATDEEAALVAEILVQADMRGTDTHGVHLLTLLRRVQKRGVTLVVVEHDMKAVMALCERIVLMQRGEKLAEGTPQQVANNPQAIAAYLGEEYATA